MWVILLEMICEKVAISSIGLTLVKKNCGDIDRRQKSGKENRIGEVIGIRLLPDSMESIAEAYSFRCLRNIANPVWERGQVP
jgi:hypothetical protein